MSEQEMNDNILVFQDDIYVKKKTQIIFYLHLKRPTYLLINSIFYYNIVTQKNLMIYFRNSDERFWVKLWARWTCTLCWHVSLCAVGAGPQTKSVELFFTLTWCFILKKWPLPFFKNPTLYNIIIFTLYGICNNEMFFS